MMKFTRRSLMASAGGMVTLGGCSDIGRESDDGQNSTSSGVTAEDNANNLNSELDNVENYFDRNGDLIAPVNNKYVQTEFLQSDHVIIHIDPEGSDDNDGLSPDTPKRTLHSAVSDAPLQGDQTKSLVLKLGAGSYSNSTSASLDLFNSSISGIKIIGETNDEGLPVAEIDADDGQGIIAENCNVGIKNCRIINGRHQIRGRMGAQITLNNCHLIAGENGFRCAAVTLNSTLEVDEDCVFDITAAENPDSNLAVTGLSLARVAGEFIGGGPGSQCISAKESSWIFIRGGAILDGSNDTRVLASSRKHSNMKVGTRGGPKVELKNAEIGLRANDYSLVSIRENLYFENVANKYDRGMMAGLEWSNQAEKDFFTIPTGSGQPPVEDLFVETGVTHYNHETGRSEFYSGEFNNWAEFGEFRRFHGESIIKSGESNVVESTGATTRNYRFDANIVDATGDVTIQTKSAYDSENDRVEFVIEEETGNGEATVVYTIFEIGRF